MKRNLTQLAQKTYDIAIVGGGIYGACLAWEATLRGLSVALLEKGDFGGATSANSLKIIHGGLRYLQNADFKRMRESIRERTNLLRIAPHLVHPLPILLPTYGRGLKSKAVFEVALGLNDLISCDRNYQIDPSKQIPRGRTISKQACLELLPNITQQGLTGGAIFTDAQVYNSERLTLAFIRSAVERGAVVANYVEVTGLLQSENQVMGVTAQDGLGNQKLEVRASTVLNATGAWGNQIQDLGQDLAKAMNFVLRRPLFEKSHEYAVGINSKSPDRKSRMLFVAPWRKTSIVGTYYSTCDRNPQSWPITESEIDKFLAQINSAYPSAQLTRADIAFVHQGVLPRKGINPQGEPTLNKHYRITNHAKAGLNGLFSVTGVKYTTARDVAQKTLDLVLQTWQKKASASISATTPVYGGDISDWAGFLQEAQQKTGFPSEIITSLVFNYGSAYPDVLSYLDIDDPKDKIDLEKAILKAQILYAIEQEMAQNLSDILLRRTELASAGSLTKEVLTFCTEVMGKQLGWNSDRIKAELQANQ